MKERTKNSIVNWALRDINDMLGVNKFLGISDSTENYLHDFKDKVEKVNLENMIRHIYAEYGVNNKRYPISSALAIMGSVVVYLGEKEEKPNEYCYSALTKEEVMVLLNMRTEYTLGKNISLVMDKSEDDGTSIKFVFPELYSNFVKEVAVKCFDIESGIIYNKK